MAKEGNLRYTLTQEAIAGLTDNQTIRTYKRSCRDFAEWTRDTYGINRASAIRGQVDVIQRYADHLQERGYSAYTIHTYLAPVCKSLGVHMDEISKPERRVETISRGRMESANLQGKREACKAQYNRLVAFQSVVGIRRAELGKLTARDVVERPDSLYVHIRQGKGGKEQWQRVLPGNESVVLATVDGLQPEDHIFRPVELRNKIDLHSLRADNAKKAYQYYSSKITADPGYRVQLLRELIARFDESNQKLREADPRRYAARRNRFLSDLGAGKQDYAYRVRGESAVVARSKHLPEVYDRVALMAVSVFHLSHWRNDVTIKNYMLT